MTILKIQRGGIIAFAAIVAILLAGWFVVVASDAEQISACVNRVGIPRIIKDGENCRKGESYLSWNIKGEKGDTGEKGEKGDMGEKGNPGSDGKDATELHLYDANGQDLGLYVGDRTSNPPEQPITLNVDMGVFFIFAQSGYETHRAHFEPRGAQLQFDELDCKGNTFVSIDSAGAGYHQNVYNVGVEYPDNFYFMLGRTTISKTIFSHSQTDRAFPCVNYSTPQTMEVLEATEFILPFTEPLAWPLEVN